MGVSAVEVEYGHAEPGVSLGVHGGDECAVGPGEGGACAVHGGAGSEGTPRRWSSAIAWEAA